MFYPYRTKRSETEPFAIGFLVSSTFLLSVLLAASFCGGCVRGVEPQHPALRTPTSQAASTVKITSFCMLGDPFDVGEVLYEGGMGSGVIIDGRHVLTANHVVECPTIPMVTVITANGHKYSMVVDKAWDDDDVARLEISTAFDQFKNVAPPILGETETGEAVCAITAVPERGGNCGIVAGITNEPTANMEVIGMAWPGNSGSGIWDSDGRLVGILVSGWFALDGVTPMGQYQGTRIMDRYLK